MARLFAAGLATRIAPLGIAPAQFMVLLELWSEDGLTQKELVERLSVEQATMANTLARMERDELIVRRPSKTDKRSRTVWLTDQARGLKEPATRAAGAQNDVALKGFDAEERALFLNMMIRVIGNMS
ncbi:MarR family winged helix-turn-helix transcriptional regulator [Primorskyibacter sp. S87]|uniref:MarR family winged helix-turn-helix transcriptional regulator n=1 Tax=Primorskyibacter sp. S87 TaxID=3415126 RepID=UPI003C7AFE27